MANKIKVDNAVLKRLAQKEKKRSRGSKPEQRYFLIVCEGKKPYSYQKNSVDMYHILQKYGNETQAIKWAESLEKLYADKEFASHNPCTKVYKLVSILKSLKTQ